MPDVRCRANLNFSGAGTDVRHGEIVVVDAASWAPWIEAGYLTVLDDPAAAVKVGVPTPADTIEVPASLQIHQGEPPADEATAAEPEGQ